ncbi:molybdenum cofactor guanylyltransferase, partial [Cryobacterium sp. TMT2-10]
MSVDLIVLAGGRGSRLDGALKPAVEVAGRSLLSRVLDARGLARRVVVVGPDSARPAAGEA